MQEPNQPLRLLFLEDAGKSAEQLVSSFRNSGLATRVHRVTSPEDLQDSLSGQAWDLFLAYDDAPAMAPDDALDTILKLGKDLPAILLVEQDSSRITDWLRRSGSCAVPFSQEERLLLVCKREYANLIQRRQLRRNEIALKEAEKRCQLLLDSSIDAIAYVHEGMHIHANPAYIKLFGFSTVDDLAGLPLIDLIHRGDQANFKQFVRQFPGPDDSDTPLNFKGQQDSGKTFDGVMSLSKAKWDGEGCMQVVIRKPADEANPALAAELAAIKNKDLLTGIYNRNYFSDALDKALEKAVAGEGSAAILDIRFDKFGNLKKEFGSIRSEQLLVEIAELLNPLVEPHGILARQADDHFLALIPHNHHDKLEQLASELLEAVRNHDFTVKQAQLSLTASIGIMPVTESSDSSTYVLERAERANHKAKDAGGDQYQLHDQQAELAAKVEEGNMVALVTQALEQERFKLSFQPIINLEEEEQHYEVFSRLINEAGEAIPASEFIGASRRAGLTTRIDRWVILQSVKALSEKRSQGHSTNLFISLGLESLKDQTLPPWLIVALRAAKIPADALVLQLAEEDVAVHPQAALELCNSLKKLQFRICINHFGCAIDPFANLDQFPVDFVKLDSTLMQNIEEDSAALDTLKETLSKLHKRDCQVIAPRVESNKIMAMLWQNSVSYAQGYFIQAPADEMNYDFN